MTNGSIHNLFKKEIQIGHHCRVGLWYVIDVLEKDQKNKNITYFSYSLFMKQHLRRGRMAVQCSWRRDQNSMSPERACLKAVPTGAPFICAPVVRAFWSRLRIGEWVAVLRKTGPDIPPIVLLMSLVHSDLVLRQWQRSRQKANDTNRP